MKYDTFLEVVRTMNMSRAAEHTHQAVSGVSYAIAKVEEELGLPLLVRGRGGMHLTEEGVALLPYIRAMVASRDALLSQAAALGGKLCGTVKVGGLFTAVTRFIPGILRKMNERYPDIEVKLVLNPYEQLAEDLSRGNIDLALAGEMHGSKLLRFIPLMRDAYKVILPDDHNFYGRERLSLEELRGEKLILPEWGLYDKSFQRLVAGSGLESQVYCKLREERAIVSMARNGFGVGILTELMIPEGENFLSATLTDWQPREFGIVTRSDGDTSPAIQCFVECVRLWAQEQGAQGELACLEGT